MPDDVKFPPTTDPLEEASGRALVEAWRASGLSGAAFCRQHGLRAQRLHYWRERLGYPIRIVRSTPSVSALNPSTTAGFVQLVVREPAPPSTTHVDIVVGGAVIRVGVGFDAGLLRKVVGALGDGG